MAFRNILQLEYACQVLYKTGLLVRTALFGVIRQRASSVPFYDSWPLKMVAIGYPETSVINYNYSLRSNTEKHSSFLLRVGRLKSGLLFRIKILYIPSNTANL
jgi:hypothetical protein